MATNLTSSAALMLNKYLSQETIDLIINYSDFYECINSDSLKFQGFESFDQLKKHINSFVVSSYNESNLEEYTYCENLNELLFSDKEIHHNYTGIIVNVKSSEVSREESFTILLNNESPYQSLVVVDEVTIDLQGIVHGPKTIPLVPQHSDVARSAVDFFFKSLIESKHFFENTLHKELKFADNIKN